MKCRNGFVSNSSSTCFVLDIAQILPALLERMSALSDMTCSLSRETGKITNIEEHIKMYEEEGFPEVIPIDRLRKAMTEYPNIMIIRESDEGMNGNLEDYDVYVPTKAVIFEFNYH